MGDETYQTTITKKDEFMDVSAEVSEDMLVALNSGIIKRSIKHSWMT